MTWLRKSAFFVAIVTLSALPGAALAARQEVIPAVAPDKLGEIYAFLMSADRAVLTLVSDSERSGKVEAITAAHITLRTRAKGKHNKWQIEKIATTEVRHMRVFHTPRPSWKSRVARTLGIVFGFMLAGPVVIHAAESGHAFLAWTALIGMPVLGGLAGEQLGRQSQETFIPILSPPIAVPDAGLPGQ